MSDTEDAYQASLAEADTMGRLHHPCLARLLEFLESNRCVGLVMELACGGTLLDALTVRAAKEERFTQVEIPAIFGDLASGLSYMHDAAGLGHLDVKPANVLLRHGPIRAGSTQLADFGLAGPLHAEGTRRGTPGYLPSKCMISN